MNFVIYLLNFSKIFLNGYGYFFRKLLRIFINYFKIEIVSYG